MYTDVMQSDILQPNLVWTDVLLSYKLLPLDAVADVSPNVMLTNLLWAHQPWTDFSKSDKLYPHVLRADIP